jgi:hypothetical protein
MATVVNQNICIKCGKQRIVVGTHEEKVGNSTVIYTDMICPDPECQKKVDVILKQEYGKREQSRINQAQRIASKKGGNLGK